MGPGVELSTQATSKWVPGAMITPKACLGNGMARNCEVKGGQRRSLNDHMRRVWAMLSGEASNLDESFDVIEQQWVSQKQQA